MFSIVHRLAEGLAFRDELYVRDTAIFELLKHGLRAEEVSKLNVGHYGDLAVRIKDAKWAVMAPYRWCLMLAKR